MSSVEKKKGIIEKLKEAYSIISECENFCPEFFEEYERRMREEDYIPSKEEKRCFEDFSDVVKMIEKGVNRIYGSIKKTITPLEGETVELKNGNPLFVYNGRVLLHGVGYVNYQIYPEDGNPYVVVICPDGPFNAVRDIDVREIAVCKDEEKRKAVFESTVRARWS